MLKWSLSTGTMAGGLSSQRLQPWSIAPSALKLASASSLTASAAEFVGLRVARMRQTFRPRVPAAGTCARSACRIDWMAARLTDSRVSISSTGGASPQIAFTSLAISRRLRGRVDLGRLLVGFHPLSRTEAIDVASSWEFSEDNKLSSASDCGAKLSRSTTCSTLVPFFTKCAPISSARIPPYE